MKRSKTKSKNKSKSKKKFALGGLMIVLMVAISIIALDYLAAENEGVMGINIKGVINNSHIKVHLNVLCFNNEVNVTSDTNVIKVTFIGNNNVVNLCESVDDPKIRKLGANNKVLYRKC